ncbi:GDSL-type esterase/lipase family protein [Flavobacterium sp. FlaQc-47]|uniref:GDSL-type esterase/lipase family protein n=1 Tax=Flavobacterium sp. FlaQc-47 TaxID=3374180 RepID=UPI003757EE3E
MRKILTLGMLLFVFSTILGQKKTFDVDLWPEGLPNSNGVDKSQVFDDAKKNYKPSIRVYLPDSSIATGRAVIAFPGGGYDHLALEHEGYEWAPFFNNMGIALIVVKYRMPLGNPEVPFSDASKAIGVVKENAKQWNINPNDVGVMGSSAGGHLASTVSTHSEAMLRPAFQILFYPVISMEKSIGHGGSRLNLLGKEVAEDKQKFYSNDLWVNRYSPRAFVALSDDDLEVEPLNGVNYYVALKKNQVPSSLYVYPSGGHGWGYSKTSFAYHKEVQQELGNWLRSFTAPGKNIVRIAFIGDSTTFGSGIPNRLNDSYPSQLGSLLGSGYWVMNFGAGGNTLLKKGNNPYMNGPSWKEALNFSPDIAVILLGTNDSKANNWEKKEGFEDDLQTMIDSLQRISSHPKIYIGFPIKAYSQRFGISDTTITEQIIPLIKKVATRNKIATIDFHLVTDGHPDLFVDEIHPNVKGAALLARAVTDVIVQEKKLSDNK